MVFFGDEGSMVKRFVEIDTHAFLEGTAHAASGVSVNGPRYSRFPPAYLNVANVVFRL